jgi:hypothetical protein
MVNVSQQVINSFTYTYSYCYTNLQHCVEIQGMLLHIHCSFRASYPSSNVHNSKPLKYAIFIVKCVLNLISESIYYKFHNIWPNSAL